MDTMNSPIKIEKGKQNEFERMNYSDADVELFMDEFVVFLLKTKKQIQRLSAAANEPCDTKEIEGYLRKMCIHEKTFDSFDITPDYSMNIEFCPKCETIFK